MSRGAFRRGPRAPEAPSPEAREALGPYARGRLTVHALGRSLPVDVPADVFSIQRIDEGTQLLLGHLPSRPPSSFLDLGCGYGALGLPVAARFPEAQGLLVDRDLLAVAAAAHNARALRLSRVRVLPSLGFRDVPREAGPFDWILCNVPARIGPEAIAHFLVQGQALLAPRGELRVVVIRDLAPVAEAAALACRLPLQAIARGPRHAVYAACAMAAGQRAQAEPDAESFYARDLVRIEAVPGRPLELARPHDVSEDRRHTGAVALLLAALPRAIAGNVLVFRCGSGAIALSLRARAETALVVAQDRDLLQTAFLRRNARALGLAGQLLRVEETLFPAQAARPGERFSLVAGEVSAGGGAEVAACELSQAFALLEPGGVALVLLSRKQKRQWLPAALPQGGSASLLLEREEGCVLRLSRPRGT